MFGAGPTHASAHNIPKIQLKIMYGLCRITDLGKSHFDFSSKNYSSKVYTCFVEFVGLVTQSTTKLGLQFSDFFCDLLQFYKFAAKAHQGSKNIFAN
jgi:hypothetical protein